MFLSVLPFGTVPNRNGGEKEYGLWNWKNKQNSLGKFKETLGSTANGGHDAKVLH